MPEETGLITARDLRGHFHEAVNSAVANQQLDLSEHSRSYLVNLMSTFVDTNALFAAGEEGTFLKPLAEIYAEAHTATSTNDRVRALRRLGDVALFVAGVLSDCLKRRIVDVDYYVSMGGGAYGWLAIRCDDGVTAFSGDVFGELSTNFVACMDVLAEAAEAGRARSDRDILRLYELWMRTGSERSATQLEALGITVSHNAVSMSRH